KAGAGVHGGVVRVVNAERGVGVCAVRSDGGRPLGRPRGGARASGAGPPAWTCGRHGPRAFGEVPARPAASTTTAHGSARVWRRSPRTRAKRASARRTRLAGA